jgi:ABC-type uncharacterized transport system substrate-binding protein
MKRREFISLLGGAAVWPFAARAQQPALPVVGFLYVASPDAYRPMADAFRQGLREAGYVEGQNVTIEYHWAKDHADRLPAMASDLVHRRVTVIAATSTPAALAAQSATKTIPIVFETGADPVRLGLVTSLNRPGGNLTGVTQLTQNLVPKELEVLHELLPAVRTVALLVNPADPAVAAEETREAISAAQTLGLELNVLKASTENDLDTVFANLGQLRVGGLVIGSDAFFTSRPTQLAALATRYKMPAVYKGREFAAAGGLLSYGTSVTEAYRLTGGHVGQILKGQKPADLPVQQATKIELYINFKTAKALGIAVPLPLSGRADEVIE